MLQSLEPQKALKFMAKTDHKPKGKTPLGHWSKNWATKPDRLPTNSDCDIEMCEGTESSFFRK